jgi:hypothetical protein
LKEVKTNEREVAPAGLSQDETDTIINFLNDIESMNADYNAEEVQKMADDLESSSVEHAIMNTTKSQILLILDFFNRGLVYITVGLTQLIMEIARQKYSSYEEFTEISGKIYMDKIIACTREKDIIRCREERKNLCRTLFAINCSIFSGAKKTDGWIKVGKFMIKNFYDRALNIRETFIEIGKSLLKQKNDSEPKENETMEPTEKKDDESKLTDVNDDLLKQATDFSSIPSEQAEYIEYMQEKQKILAIDESCDEIDTQEELIETEIARRALKQKIEKVFKFQEFHEIDDFDEDEFLKEKDPTCEVKKFVKKVINSINKYNLENKKSIRKFDDDKYHLLVIQRYPKETNENVITYQILIRKDIYGRLKVANTLSKRQS